MKIYLLSQDVNHYYDTWNEVVVYAENEDEARQINPAGEWGANKDWADKPDQVKVKYLGEGEEGAKKGIICESFRAG